MCGRTQLAPLLLLRGFASDVRLARWSLLHTAAQKCLEHLSTSPGLARRVLNGCPLRRRHNGLVQLEFADSAIHTVLVNSTRTQQCWFSVLDHADVLRLHFESFNERTSADLELSNLPKL